ncbi:hypothetical protein BGZ98_005064 [Dissophora globulifera]|nr:hypothetical protein BGZ98_005064 [Dissophora globulifera]
MNSPSHSESNGSGMPRPNVLHQPTTHNDNVNDNYHNDDTATSERTPLLQSHNTPSTSNPAVVTDIESRLPDGLAGPSQPPVTGERLRHWHYVYIRFVKVVGFILILCLAAAAVSPWVAQRVVDRAMVLEIQRTDIHNMDQSGFQISIQSTVYLDTTKDGFLGLSGLVQRIMRPTITVAPTTLSLSIPTIQDGMHMAEFEVEEQQMQLGDTHQLDLSTHVLVTNATLMAEFFSRTLHQSTVDLAVRGPIMARVGSLWYMKLRIDRAVTMEGLKGVQNATLVSMSLPGNHPLGGVIMSGVARIKNPSKAVSLQMGAVSFGIYLPSLSHPDVDLYKIAEVSSPGLRLDAGKFSNLELSGRLFHLDDWTLSERKRRTTTDSFRDNNSGSEKQLLLSRLLSQFIQGHDSTIQVRALSEGIDLPPWLAEAFKSIALAMVFPGSRNKDFIRSLDMNKLEFGFADDSQSALLSGRMSSVLQLPPNITFPIKLLKMKPAAWIKGPGGEKMASLEIPDFLPTQSQQEGTTLEVHVDMEHTPLQVAQDRLPEFYQFLNSSFTKEWIHLGIAGDALAVVECGLGIFELGPIPFDVITTQRGFGGLVSAPPVLEKLDVVDSTEYSLTVKATLRLWNPSSISAILGDMSFLWSFGGYVIGMATVADITLVAGNNTIECIGIMDSSLDCTRKADPTCEPGYARNASREFISKYISGDNTTTIDILGYAESTKIPLLQPMISSFKMASHLPEIEQDFLISATMYLLSHMLVLELQNPLDAVITVLYVNGTASYKDEPLGHMLIDFEHDIARPKPILIPANDHQNETSGYVKTPRLPVAMDLSSVGYEALKKALGGTLEVDVVCHIKAKVGSMLMWVDFVRDGVKANVRKGF